MSETNKMDKLILNGQTIDLSPDYTNVRNKPKINGVTVDGNKTLDDFGVATKQEVENVSEKVAKLPYGIYYGQYDDTESLPNASQLTEKGYAHVATAEPDIFYIYIYDGEGSDWQESGNKFDAGSLESNLSTKSKIKAPTTKAVKEGIEAIDVTTEQEFTSTQKETARTNINAQEDIVSMADKLPVVAALNNRTADIDQQTSEVKALGYKVLKPYNPNDLSSTFKAQIESVTNVTNNSNLIFEIRDEFDLGATNVLYNCNTLVDISENETPNNYYYNNTAIVIGTGDGIILPNDCVLLNEERTEIATYETQILFKTAGTYYVASRKQGNKTVKKYDSNCTVSIPSGCTLKFNGGKIKNGVISGSSVYIKADYNVFEEIVFAVNTVKNDAVCLSWFKVESDDYTQVLNSICNLTNKIYADVTLIVLSSPVIVTKRELTIIGLSDGGTSDTSANSARNTNIVPSSLTWDAGENENSFFIINETQSVINIEKIRFKGTRSLNSYPVSNAIYFKRTATGRISHCTFQYFNGAAIAITESTEGLEISDNVCAQCGAFVVASSVYDNNNLLNIASDGAVAMLYIEKNYINYCNYGLIIVAHCTVHIIDNCISHSSCYAIYCMCERDVVISKNYFESPGKSNFWITKDNGKVDSEDTFQTVDNITTEHYGENNKQVTGWGVGTDQIRPAIYLGAQSIGAIIGQESYMQQSTISISCNRISPNWVRTNVGTTFSNDKEIAGLDAFIIIGNLKVSITDTSLAYSAVNSGHYGGNVAPKYYYGYEGTSKIPTINTGNTVIKPNYSVICNKVPQIYKVYKNYIYVSTNGGYSCNCVTLDNDVIEEKQIDVFNKVSSNYSTSSVRKNLWYCVDDIKIINGIPFYKFKESGNYRWIYNEFSKSSLYDLTLFRFYYYTEESGKSISIYSINGNTIISYFGGCILNKDDITTCDILIDKDSIDDDGTLLIRTQSYTDTNLYMSMPLVKSVNSNYFKDRYGKNCDSLGLLHIGDNTYRNIISSFDGLLNEGFEYYSVDDNKKEIWNGSTWIDSNGNGDNIPRPTSSLIGSMHFDTTLGKPIFWNGNAWINGNGDYIVDNEGTLENRLALTSPAKGQQFKLTGGANDVYLIYGDYGWLNATDRSPWFDDSGTLNAMYDKYNYTLLTLEPGNWPTKYNTYYKVVNGVYTLLTTAETWTADTYYKKDENAYKGIQVKLTDSNTDASGSLTNRVVKWNGTKWVGVLNNVALKAATPTLTFSTEGNTTTCQINCATTGGTIYYTTDGTTTPTSSSTQYSTTFNLSTGNQIQAVCVIAHMNNSAAGFISSIKPTINVATAGKFTIEIDGQVDSVYYKVGSGEYTLDDGTQHSGTKGTVVTAYSTTIGCKNSNTATATIK